MSGYLELADGGLIGVRDGLTLGRVAACDVVVDDTKASRRHARMIVEGGVVEIEDLQSSNGTLLNGKPVERRMLRDGDQIKIGKTVIVYREGELPGRSKAGAPAAGAVQDDGDDLFADAAPAPAGAAPADPFDDGDDLFGGGDAPAEPAPPSAPAPPSRPEPRPQPAPQAPAGDVVEFEDEVVEVQQTPPPPRRAEPAVEVRKAPRERSAGAGGGAKGADPDVAASSGRILQYSKKDAGGGLLGDDLGQMSGGMRLLIVLLVIAVGGGLAYGIMVAMR
ncbi:MAG: FHA domain-containing protein [Planctomycetes bacterium]|nr:FHA domain-containing protein [Planctomycetota bacterium]